ncbi:MAG: hypothetical protein A2033_12835 [Bacteroidetes bacterium GWA2_31_9]|nr:MAG: hypothetical protein A2033_12835 [Bacteroidetes bacterium GWA2_31_9]
MKKIFLYIITSFLTFVIIIGINNLFDNLKEVNVQISQNNNYNKNYTDDVNKVKFDSLTNDSIILEEDTIKLAQEVKNRKNLNNQDLYILDEINFRESPSINSKCYHKIKPSNHKYKVIKKSELSSIIIKSNKINDYWYQIEYSGKLGWVFGYYTTLKEI